MAGLMSKGMFFCPKCEFVTQIQSHIVSHVQLKHPEKLPDDAYLTPLNDFIGLLTDMDKNQLQNAKSKIHKILGMIERLE